MPDHGHHLLDGDPRAEITVVVGTIKGFTSHALRNEVPWLKKRLPMRWTRSPCIATVGAVTLDGGQQYITAGRLMRKACTERIFLTGGQRRIRERQREAWRRGLQRDACHAHERLRTETAAR